ncbi:hypothetical protein GCM10028868_29810 [Virgibacillus kimchii]
MGGKFNNPPSDELQTKSHLRMKTLKTCHHYMQNPAYSAKIIIKSNAMRKE